MISNNQLRRSSSAGFVRLDHDDPAQSVRIDFICPISRQIMRNPMVTCDGHTYDHAFISEWFTQGHRTSPRTGNTLHSLALAPNWMLRNLMSEDPVAKHFLVAPPVELLGAPGHVAPMIRQNIGLRIPPDVEREIPPTEQAAACCCVCVLAALFGAWMYASVQLVDAMHEKYQ